jgi:mycothiol synthase
LLPEGIFLVTDEKGVIAGTATGVLKEKECENLGYVHMVSIRPEYRGLKLGKPLNAAVLRYLVEKQCTNAYLTTDDFRIPAIKVYLALGFQPVLQDVDMEERWMKLMQEMGTRQVATCTAHGEKGKVLRLDNRDKG